MTTLLQDIEAFCIDHKLSDTEFGCLALNDRPFVAQLRNGRDIRQSTSERLRKFMTDYQPEQAA